MGRPAGKWPHYALENLEDSVYRLKKIERVLAQAMEAIEDAATLRALSDARVQTLECVDTLMRSRTGNYKQQEAAPQWQPVDDKTAEAVARVVAIRRA
jgi:hypothetical protein